MDCISVYAAGFHNVIASSGTVTELQAKLLGRFSKERSSQLRSRYRRARPPRHFGGLAVEENPDQVLTLEQDSIPIL